MEILRPYSSRLTRGTLLLIHSPALRLRYARIRRGITVDAVSLVASGIVVALAGWIGNAPAAIAAGMVTSLAAICLWGIRTGQIRFRERNTPAMLFVAESGISAIMPDSSTRNFRWSQLSAHEAGFRPSVLATYDVRRQREDLLGLMLKCETGCRLYLTRDLDGFADLLEVLVEMNVPMSSTSFRLDVRRMNRPDLLERRIW